MRVRYYFRCINCQASILARVGIGYGELEQFRFECARCGQAISGEVPLDQEHFRVGRLRALAGAEEIDEVAAPDYEHAHQAGFGSSLTRADPSPFLSAFGRHGLEFETRLRQQGWFVQMPEQTVALATRVIKNYSRQQWGLASKAFSSIEVPVTPEARDVRRAIHRLLELILAPIGSTKAHATFSLQFADAVDAFGRDAAEIRRFLTDPALAALATSHQELLALYPQFLNSRSEYKTALLEFDPERPERPFPAGLSVGYGTDVERQKLFYVNAYEAVARSLTFLVAVVNWKRQGAYDRFPAHPDEHTQFHPKSLEQFARGSHGVKVSYLAPWPIVGVPVAMAMDRTLRNAIGHNTLHFRSESETFVYPEDKAGKVLIEIAQGEFELKCLRLLIGAHNASNAIRMIVDLVELRSETAT